MIDRAIECKLCWENGSCLACGCDTFDVLKSGKPCNIPDDIERRFNEYETLMRQKYWKCIHEQPYDLHYCMEEHEKEEFDKLLYLVSKKYPNE